MDRRWTLNMDDERSPSLASTTSSVPSALIAQIIAAAKLIVKSPVTVTEQTLSASRQLTSTISEPSPSPSPPDEDPSTPIEIDSDFSAHTRFSPNDALNEKITAITIFSIAIELLLQPPYVIELLLQPPYVIEPNVMTALRMPGVSETAIVSRQKSVLRAFYGRNTFECEFHTTLTKFLRQMDINSLNCLKPGSVRLTNRLTYVGFVHIRPA